MRFMRLFGSYASVSYIYRALPGALFRILLPDIMSNDTHTRRRHHQSQSTADAPSDTQEIEKSSSMFGLSGLKGSRAELRDNLEDTGAFLLLLLLDITKMVLRMMKQPM
jgi:hypothetical protein